MKEATIQKKLQEYILARGAYVIKTIATSRAGVPDLICCYKGQFIAIEVKTKSGTVSKLQEYNLEKIRKAGGKALIARDIADLGTIFG